MSTILSIIPYRFYPPTNGGALRSFHILREMSRKHKVYVLTIQPLKDFEGNVSPAFPLNVNIVSISENDCYKSIFNFLPKRLANAINSRILTRSLKSANQFLLNAYPVLKKLLKSVHFELINFENLESLALLGSLLKNITPQSYIFYDAHNVDSELWRSRYVTENNKIYLKYSRNALLVEKKLSKNIDCLFCCSDDDLTKLKQLNKSQLNGCVVPNGVDIESRPFDINSEKYLSSEILFCGSLDYFPNKQGILWFYNEILPFVKNIKPNIKLTIIGNVEQKDVFMNLIDDPSVNFIGNVESVIPYYNRCSIAVVPLLSGSGTRLKILEAMSMGVPVVSTTIGAEGIKYIRNEHLLIADDPAVFAEQIFKLLHDQLVYQNIRKAAYQLVSETYDWKMIGKKINESISDKLYSN